MNFPIFGLFGAVCFLFGMAVTDFSEAMQGVEVEPIEVRAPCDPKHTQVLRMDNSNQVTQVLDRGVNCVVVRR